MPEQSTSPSPRKEVAQERTHSPLAESSLAKTKPEPGSLRRQAEIELYQLARLFSRELENEKGGRYGNGAQENMFKFLVSEIPNSFPQAKILQQERFMILRVQDNRVTIETPRPVRGRDGTLQLRSEPEALSYNKTLARETDRPLRNLYQLCAKMKAEELPSPTLYTYRENAMNSYSCFVFPSYDHSTENFDGVIIAPWIELDSLRSQAYSRMFFNQDENSSTTLQTGRFEKIDYRDPNTGAESSARVLLAPANGKLIREASGGWYVSDLREDMRKIPKMRIEQFKTRNKEIDTWNAKSAAYTSHQNSIKNMLPIFFARPPKPGPQPSSNITWCNLKSLYQKKAGVAQVKPSYYPSSKWHLDQETGTFHLK